MQQGFIKYIVIIIVILVLVFLSQQPYFRDLGKSFYAKGMVQADDYLAKGANWVNQNVYSKIGGEVQNRGAIINNEVSQEKNKVSENILDKAKNYFSGVANSVVHPGSPTCAPATSTAPAK